MLCIPTSLQPYLTIFGHNFPDKPATFWLDFFARRPPTLSTIAAMDLFSEQHETRLRELGIAHASRYAKADPFPHIVIDDFLPVDVAKALVREFPAKEQLPWQSFDRATEKKLAFPKVERLPRNIRDVLYFLNAAPTVRFLEGLTGISGLISDPHFSGGGLHQIERGGFLEVHADFNRYDHLKLDRRLNLLIYLNEDWREEYGGQLELWDKSMSRCETRILPLFNRCVVFSTTSFTFHGHPHTLQCPEGRSRRSIATYYYTNGRPLRERSLPHSTLFQVRPGQSQHGDPVSPLLDFGRSAAGKLRANISDVVKSIRRKS